jgi:aminopeptidase N
VVKWEAQDLVQIEYPEYFTVNSLYFHTTPKESVDLLSGSFKSVDGREIPVEIYTAKSGSSSSTLNELQRITLSVLKELESDYGAFPHPSVTIYNANLSSMGLGGMEYAGATVTNRGALAHELFHSYFARGVTPANGNAGWIDESLASWRDNRYQRLQSLSGSSRMAAHEYYTRATDTAAYSFGARFMAFLDGKFAAKGGLKPFMNKLLEKRLFSPLFTEDFVKEMEAFYGEDLTAIFSKYIYNRSHKEDLNSMKVHAHRKLSGKELQSIL